MKPAINELAAVMLAGGFGTRVKHLLPGVPKPMAPVAGRPFLEWVVRFVAAQGIQGVVLSTGHLAVVVERHFQNQPVSGVCVQCVTEQSPLGTAGGFLHAARASNATPPAWLVLNGDSLVFADLTTVLAPLADAAIGGVILGRSVPDASRYGTLATGATGELLRFEEKRPGSGVINGGIYLLRSSLLDQFPQKTPLSFEEEVFPALLRMGIRLKVVVTEAPFLDIGTPESLSQAESFIKQNMRYFSMH